MFIRHPNILGASLLHRRLGLRNEGRIGDEVMHRIERDREERDREERDREERDREERDREESRLEV